MQRDPVSGEAFGVASNSGGMRYPWGIERFEESIEHRTSDLNPANTSVKGTYALTEELEDRTLRFEQDVVFSSDEKNFRMIFKLEPLMPLCSKILSPQLPLVSETRSNGSISSPLS